MNKILDSLNESQRAAVEHLDGPLLILAGAGSGKTKTITTRLAYLIDSIGIAPNSTLTLTFTNKAASQMRTRALNLMENKYIAPPLLCTFHKFGLLFLKLYINRLNRRANFVLIDTDDKNKIIKNFHSQLNTKLIASEISKMKNWIISHDEALQKAQGAPYKEIAEIYKKYDEYLAEKNLVDFDDLLLLSYKILSLDSDLRAETSRRYQYIMVDEYQDTNELQYKLLRELCATHDNLCVVGDDDQSIYGWRGANVNNILDFGTHFKNTKIIRLEENYRSTEKILDIANKLISFNSKRLGKTLKSTKGAGKDVELLNSLDERIESSIIVSRIKEMIENGVSPSDIAILFRLNALSRSVEFELNRQKIPYKIIGTVRFYERSEIKDILSYLRLIINPHDDFSLTRVINRPKRGIGKTTQSKFEQFAQIHRISIYQAIFEHSSELQIPSKHIESLRNMFEMLDNLREILKDSTMKFIDEFSDKIDVLESYKNTQDDVDRSANVSEFYGYFRDFIIHNPTASLEDYLNDISLSSESDSANGDSISCMSIHSAKGLEFEHVFVIGLEEGFFPIVSENTSIEEERRLGYVAFTRAKSELVLSCVQSRYYHSRRTELDKSRFLSECGLIQGKIQMDKEQSFKKNDLIIHKVFGTGRVVNIDGSGESAVLYINFGGVEKRILASYVKKA